MAWNSTAVTMRTLFILSNYQDLIIQNTLTTNGNLNVFSGKNNCIGSVGDSLTGSAALNDYDNILSRADKINLG